MKFADLFRFAFGNLRRQKIRTALTVVGVVVGTGAIVLMVSLGIGLQAQTIDLFSKVDFLTTIRVFPQKRNTGFMNFGRPLPGPVRKLDDAVVEEMKSIPGVLTAYPSMNFVVPLLVEVEGRKTPISGNRVEYIGLPQAGIVPLYRSALLAGGFWEGESPAERVAVVPGDMMVDMGIVKLSEGGGLPGDPAWQAAIGRTVKVTFNVAIPKEGEEGRPPDEAEPEEDDEALMETKKVTRRFRIIGVYDSQNIGNPFAPGVFVPLEQGKEIAKARMVRPGMLNEGYPGIVVKVVDASRADEVRREIDARGYGTLTISDIVEVISYVFVTLQAVLGAVASIGLIVAFFGIANTMVMAILERTREIGIMKALGARNREIRRLFLVEAASIGFLGALFGISAGWAMGKGANWIAAWYVVKRGGPENMSLFLVSPMLAAGTMAFAVVVAVIAGLYPAWRASRLDPVAALRSL